ncbi:MAG: hypothetical protein HC876_11355 [Chloroflexaceae bacterium]|nr:hypothetical protein [Chloroflexaceae bacterium]NJO06060.1 hypothetical protein [Chloroflexaceae bacterium]
MKRTLFGMALVALMLALTAGVFGWSFATPAAAQTTEEPTPTPSTTDGPRRGPGGEGRPGAGGRGDFADHEPGERLLLGLVRATASETGLTIADVTEAVQNGSTLAQVAEANGSTSAAVVQVVMERVEEMTERAVERGRITEEEAATLRATAEQTANDLMNDPNLADELEALIDKNMERMFRMALVRGTVEVTDLRPREILDQLRDGATLAEIVTAAGYNTADVIAAATDNVDNSLERLVDRGVISQAKADECRQTFQDTADQLMNEPFPISEN